MAKVTVYVPDEQLAALRQLVPAGPSKAFQAFIGHLQQGEPPLVEHRYADRLLPLAADVERLRRQAAVCLERDGGPAASDGPIRAALTILAHEWLLRDDPAREAGLRAEFGRFGLQEIVEQAWAVLQEPEADPE